MQIFKNFIANTTRRQERPTATRTAVQPENRQSVTLTPRTSVQTPTALSGTIIVAKVMRQATKRQESRPTTPTPCRRAWEERRAAFYATLPAPIDRPFPSNHVRQLWKIEQGFRRWLYHHNREKYEELKRLERWEWA